MRVDCARPRRPHVIAASRLHTPIALDQFCGLRSSGHCGLACRNTHLALRRQDCENHRHRPHGRLTGAVGRRHIASGAQYGGVSNAFAAIRNGNFRHRGYQPGQRRADFSGGCGLSRPASARRSRRPAHACAFGLIDRWTAVASHIPRIANFFTQAEPLASVAKRLIRIAPQRRITPFAEQSFSDWFGQRAARHASGAQVILWPDTFNNFFHPDVAKAAVDVLEHAGFHGAPARSAPVLRQAAVRVRHDRPGA